MRRFLRTLRRLGSPARRTRQAIPTSRPGLEVLEGRDLPSGLTPITGITGPAPRYPVGSLQPVSGFTPPVISQPSPTMLAGKSVTLAQPGDPTNVYGVLTITSLTLQSDGSYSVCGEYQSSIHHLTNDLQVPIGPVTVTGTVSAAQFAGLGTSTCTINLDGRVSGYANVFGGRTLVDEHVHFSGTLTLTWTKATVAYAQIYDCLEDHVTHNRIDPFSGSVPAAGTFV